MLKILKNLEKLNFYEKLFLLFPIILILRPVIINSFLILVTLILIYALFQKKYFHIIKNEAWIWFFFIIYFLLYF